MGDFVIADVKINKVEGRAMPLPGDDVDTDRIMPGRFLKVLTFDGIGAHVFEDERKAYAAEGRIHPFDDERFRGARILLVNRNFGCGSSREHAPQGLMRAGTAAIIGESFAEIFSDNCAAIGIALAAVSKGEIEKMMSFARHDPNAVFSVSLADKKITYGVVSAAFSTNEQKRLAFVNGTWDSINTLLSAGDSIEKSAARIPYLSGFAGYVRRV